MQRRRRVARRSRPGWVCGAAGLGLWRRRAGFVAPPGWIRRIRRRVSVFATTPAPQKRRENCGTGKKVPSYDADRAKIPPSPIRHHRKNVDPAAPEDARMRRRRRSTRRSSHRIGRRHVSGFATPPAPQKRRGNCGTGKKVPPYDADRAKIPPSRGVAGASSIGSEYNAERMTHGAWRTADGGRRTAHGAWRTAHGGRRTADNAERTAHDTQLTTHNPHRGWPPTDRAGDLPRRSD